MVTFLGKSTVTQVREAYTRELVTCGLLFCENGNGYCIAKEYLVDLYPHEIAFVQHTRSKICVHLLRLETQAPMWVMGEDACFSAVLKTLWRRKDEEEEDNEVHWFCWSLNFLEWFFWNLDDYADDALWLQFLVVYKMYITLQELRTSTRNTNWELVKCSFRQKDFSLYFLHAKV